ncbi:MAG TPA: ArnT family glycosyltransferase [Cyclobacteriaceae bacterium]
MHYFWRKREVQLHPTDQKTNLYFFFSSLALLIIALYLNLGIYPLYLEEPRRALIALEMLFNGNLIVPTEMGEYYYKKPPVYNWIIIAGYKVFGNYSEWAVRAFSVLSFLLTGGVLYWASRKYIDQQTAIFSTLFFLISADILFYFSITSGEIDLFYSLVTYASFISIYHFYIKGNYYLLFGVTYILGAVGTLTKGLPSLPFLGISILTFFIYKKDFRKLFSLPHYLGLAIYLLIIGGYIFIYNQYNNPIGFLSTKDSLVTQTTERTLFFNSLFDFIQNLVLFPLENIRFLLPGSLLVVFFFRKDLFRVIRSNDFVVFSALMLLANISLYWLSPGTRSRYLYMFFPLMHTILLYVYLQGDHHRYLMKIFNWVLVVFPIAGFIGAVALPFIPPLAVVPNLTLLSIIFSIIFLIIVFLYFKVSKWRLYLVIITMIVLRIAFDLTVLEVRAEKSTAAKDKEIATKIVEIVDDNPLYLFKASRFSLTTVFYIERERGKVLSRKYTTDHDSYFISNESFLQDIDYKSLYSFRYHDKAFYLVQF